MGTPVWLSTSSKYDRDSGFGPSEFGLRIFLQPGQPFLVDDLRLLFRQPAQNRRPNR